MQQWEYKEIRRWRLDPSLWVQIKDAGLEGWELTTIFNGANSDEVSAIFKRPVEQPQVAKLDEVRHQLQAEQQRIQTELEILRLQQQERTQRLGQSNHTDNPTVRLSGSLLKEQQAIERRLQEYREQTEKFEQATQRLDGASTVRFPKAPMPD